MNLTTTVKAAVFFNDVGLRSQSGKDLLTSSYSARDPKLTCMPGPTRLFPQLHDAQLRRSISSWRGFAILETAQWGGTVVADLKDAGGTEPNARIFISYSRHDAAFADCLELGLKERGFAPLIDRGEIYAFEDWWKRIQSLIIEADTIVFVLSPESVLSETCRKEVAFAASLQKRFAPIVCRRVDNDSVPQALRRLHFIFFDDDSRFEASMDQLAEALSTDIVWIRKHTEYGALAHRWEVAGRPGSPGLLLRSPILEEAEWWIASRPPSAPGPDPTTRAFIAESRKHDDALKAEEKAARRRRRHLELALIGVLIVISSSGIAYALWTNLDYLQASKERIADSMWPKTLSPELERAYVEMVLQPGQIITFRECTRCPEMVVVPRGQFMMGSPGAKDGTHENEAPQHKVVIASNFAVSKFEVTFDEWKACTDARACEDTWDQAWGRGRRPAININWDQAQQFVNWMSHRIGKPRSYRLLSETEWEYAARAGEDKAYPWGDKVGSVNANCDGCGSRWDYKQSAPVGSFAPNGFGLYDMNGNVFEWVEDCYHSNYQGAPDDGSAWTTSCEQDYRVRRGGSWYVPPENIRSATRDRSVPGDRDNDLGFRVAKTLSP